MELSWAVLVVPPSITLVLIYVVLPLFKGAAAVEETQSTDQAQAIIRDVLDLELDRNLGRVDEDDYKTFKDQKTEELRTALASSSERSEGDSDSNSDPA